MLVPGEPAMTDGADERTDAKMGAFVTQQVVSLTETSATETARVENVAG